MLNDVELEQEHPPSFMNAPQSEDRESNRQNEAQPPFRRSRSQPRALEAAPDARTDRTRPPPKPKSEQDDGREGETARRGALRRHPALAAIGAASLLLAAGAGYVYWDNASH